jgi:hypothetical protein
MKVTLLDTVTGKTKEHDDIFDAEWWVNGNGMCDCNRALFMGVDLDETAIAPGLGICAGEKRFLIIAADDPEYSLQEFNRRYPTELLKKHQIIP